MRFSYGVWLRATALPHEVCPAICDDFPDSLSCTSFVCGGTPGVFPVRLAGVWSSAFRRFDASMGCVVLVVLRFVWWSLRFDSLSLVRASRRRRCFRGSPFVSKCPVWATLVLYKHGRFCRSSAHHRPSMPTLVRKPGWFFRVGCYLRSFGPVPSDTDLGTFAVAFSQQCVKRPALATQIRKQICLTLNRGCVEVHWTRVWRHKFWNVIAVFALCCVKTAVPGDTDPVTELFTFDHCCVEVRWTRSWPHRSGNVMPCVWRSCVFRRFLINDDDGILMPWLRSRFPSP